VLKLKKKPGAKGLNMLHILSFFSSKCRLFHNAIFFGSCIIHVLIQGVLKFKKNSGAKGSIRGIKANWMQQNSFIAKLLSAQHVSGTIMPIIRSSRIIKLVAACGT
jgi:hypothetical protein